MNQSYIRTLYGRVSNQMGHWMKHHPIASNCFLCLNLWVAGDTLAQHSEYKLLKQHNLLDQGEQELEHAGTERSTSHSHSSMTSSSSSSSPPSFWNEYDPLRTFQCASYGAAVSGPILAIWYPFLERVCIQYNVTARYGIWGAPILKVVADELFHDPPTLIMFFGYMNICEGGTWQTFSNKVSTQFWPSWFTSLAVWPVVLLGTFRFLKTYAHAPVISVCCIVWDGFLSHRNFLAKLEEKRQQSSITIATTVGNDNQKENDNPKIHQGSRNGNDHDEIGSKDNLRLS